MLQVLYPSPKVRRRIRRGSSTSADFCSAASHFSNSAFAGTWEITEFAYNKTAVSFWRSILNEYTGGKFQERVVQGEVYQMFTSANRQRAR